MPWWFFTNTARNFCIMWASTQYKVDLVKSAVWASMASGRLEDLILISSEKTVFDTLKIHVIIDKFAVVYLCDMSDLIYSYCVLALMMQKFIYSTCANYSKLKINDELHHFNSPWHVF